MKNKKLKYILIFIFIICLLIPISCINIFAYNYYGNFYLTNTGRVYTEIYFYSYNADDLYVNNTNYNISSYEYIYFVMRINQRNNSTSQTEYYLKLYAPSNTLLATIFDTNYSDNYTLNYFDKIQIYGDSDCYFKAIDRGTSRVQENSGNGIQLTFSTNYNPNNNDYIWCGLYNSTYKNKLNVDFKFIITPSSISFDKTYNISFYNNDILYDSITISGASASGYAPFEEISQIKYGNTIVYDNSVWSSGYNSTLRYNQLMTEPNITTINSDCNSIITFTTQSFVATESITNRYQLGTFYNDSSGDVPYSDIYITGTVASGTTSPFITISEIKYNNTSVYSNGSFYSDYSSTLYSYNNNPLNLTIINSDANNIVTFINLSLGTYVPLNDILSGIAGIFGVTTTLIASAQTNWVLAIFMAMSVFMLLVLVIFKFVRGNSSGGSK